MSKINRVTLTLACAFACAVRPYEPSLGKALDDMRAKEKQTIEETDAALKAITEQEEQRRQTYCNVGATYGNSYKQQTDDLLKQAKERSKEAVNAMEEVQIGFLNLIRENKIGGHFLSHVETAFIDGGDVGIGQLGRLVGLAFMGDKS